MTRLVFVTQVLEPEHPALGQTLDLVDALSARVDELTVVTRRSRWRDPPPNVRILEFGRPTRLGRVVAFERAVAVATTGADAIVAHMVPQFAVLAAPVARARRVPLLLWYTHWHGSHALRLATRASSVALSVDVTSFPLVSPKVRGIGHAIDVKRFDGSPPAEHPGPLRLLALGRTARWKGLATLAEAFLQADIDATLEIRGPSLTDDEVAHRRELASIPDPRIRVEEPIGRSEIPALLRSVDVVVSPAEPPTGATLDKAVYEAAACARPVVTTNAALAPFLANLPLQLLAPERDPAALAETLRAVAAASVSVRAETGSELRLRVVRDHSLEHWADAVISAVREVRSPRGG